ncbi:MAG TPA: hypothetical protein VJA94_06050 [Candidatus Angelobacter sp.]
MTTFERNVRKKCRLSILGRSMAVYILFLIAVTVAAQTVPAQSQVNPAEGAAAQTPLPTTQAGILPVFALDVNFDPLWIDSADVPGKSAQYNNNGVNGAFQKAWETLQPAGFKTIRFQLDLRDARSAARLANLCIWAKANQVNLIAVLEHFPTGSSLAEFPAAFVSRLRAGDGGQLAAYSQVLQFQFGSPENVNELHPEIKAGQAQKILLSAIDSFRNAEVQALQGSGVAPTPIAVSASFDYELIQQGAIPGAALDSSAEQKAQASLKRSLEPLAANANVDAINIEWFPGSISPGDVDRFAILVRELETAFPGKQVLLTTGFSTAFNPADRQDQFLTLATTNLWNFRLSDGGDSSHFLGVIFEQALKEPISDTAAPAGSGDPSHWNWKEKSSQLARMLSGGKASAELKWWLSKVRGNMALIAPPSHPSGAMDFTPLTALQTFQQISAAVAQARQGLASPTTAAGDNQAPAVAPDAQINQGFASNAFSAGYGAPGSGATPAGPSTQVSGSSASSAYQQFLMALVQQTSTQLTTALVTKMTGNKTQAQYPASATPDPVAYSQTAADPAAAQPQVPASSSLNDGSSLPQAFTATAASSPNVPDSNAGGYDPATPAPQVSSATGASPYSPATTAPVKVSASVSRADAVGAKSGQQGSSTGIASGQPASVPAARSLRPAMAVSTSSEPTNSQITRTAQPVATTQPSQGARVASPSAVPSPSPGSVQPLPTVPAGVAAANLPVRPGPPITRAAQPVATTQPGQSARVASPSAVPSPSPAVRSVQPLATVPAGVAAANLPVRPGPPIATQTAGVAATNLPVRPGPAISRSPSVPATNFAPVAAPGTTNQIERPGPRSASVSPAQANGRVQAPPPAPPMSAGLPSNARFDLSVSSADIRITPTAAGHVAVTALIRNTGTMGTGAATVSFRVAAAGRQLAASQPIGFSIAANGVFQTSWTTPVPPGQNLQLCVSVSAGGDSNPANNQAVLAFTTPAAVTSRR